MNIFTCICKYRQLFVCMQYSLAAVSTDMNGGVCGALVQFGCYQHRYEWRDLWCSSTVQLLSTQTRVNGKAKTFHYVN